MSKTNEYYRMLQEDEEFRKYEKDVGDLIDEHMPPPKSKESRENLKEYKNLPQCYFIERKITEQKEMPIYKNINLYQFRLIL